MAVTLFPGVVFACLLLRNLWMRRWQNLAGWLAASMVVALLIAGAMLFDSRRNPMFGEEHYTWQGWYLVWFLGAYGTGVLGVIATVGRPVISLIWRRTRLLSSAKAQVHVR